jgi:hypothetical protein
MADTAKQIIPDPNSVIRCLDPEMLTALSSHETFIIGELLKAITKKSTNIIISDEELWSVFNTARNAGSYSASQFHQQVVKLINQENSALLNTLIADGKSCSLLQPDGKGWQTGKLKLCFEFIPDETESEENNKKTIQTDRSPLDEIRNSLAVESN